MSAGEFGKAAVEIILLSAGVWAFMAYIIAPVWSWLTMEPIEYFWTLERETEETYSHASHYNRDVTHSEHVR